MQAPVQSTGGFTRSPFRVESFPSGIYSGYKTSTTTRIGGNFRACAEARRVCYNSICYSVIVSGTAIGKREDDLVSFSIELRVCTEIKPPATGQVFVPPVIIRSHFGKIDRYLYGTTYRVDFDLQISQAIDKVVRLSFRVIYRIGRDCLQIRYMGAGA